MKFIGKLLLSIAIVIGYGVLVLLAMPIVALLALTSPIWVPILMVCQIMENL